MNEKISSGFGIKIKKPIKKELEQLNKTKLIQKIGSQYANYMRLKNKYLVVCLENGYLLRRNKQLKKRNEILNKNGNHHSFRDLK